MKRRFAIALTTTLLLVITTGCVNTSNHLQTTQNPGVFSIHVGVEDVGDYTKTEELFLAELRTNGLVDYEMYDSSELSADVLENRKGTTIIERCIGVVTDASSGNEHGIVLNAHDPEKNHIGYGALAGIDEIADGTVVLSYMIYNPDNNYIDDITERYDFVIS